jgi:hypothetical protein
MVYTKIVDVFRPITCHYAKFAYEIKIGLKDAIFSTWSCCFFVFL